MTMDPDDFSLDELASAYLDNEATPDERAVALASPDVIAVLHNAISNAYDWQVRQQAAQTLGTRAPFSAALVNTLLQGLLNRVNGVRIACTSALAQLGQRFPANGHVIATALMQALANPAFKTKDQMRRLSGYDYAFAALSELAATGVLDRERPSTDR